MKKMNLFSNYVSLGIVIGGLSLMGCKKDEDLTVVPPASENEMEVITDIKLIFTNTNDASDVVEARAQDPDGEGVQELVILDTINLGVSKTYTLTYEIFNNLETPGEDIGAEILEEDNEHQFFYGFSNNAFASPSGDGNIDAVSDPLTYNDVDENGNAVGLSTSWTTPSSALSGGLFRTRLQHQPDVKTSTSGPNDGDTDFDLSFVLNIQ
tara:strand:+ start:147 stop:776 length:630 start_codon:yes stop_codon:yes gene_type:complete